jgi:hypothetical protein
MQNESEVRHFFARVTTVGIAGAEENPALN